MKVFIKLTILTILMVIIISLYFEYVVNRPLNVYVQYALTTVMIIGTVMFLVYFVKQILKILNP